MEIVALRTNQSISFTPFDILLAAGTYTHVLTIIVLSSLISLVHGLEITAIDLQSATVSRFDFPITDPRKQVYYGTQGTDQIGDMRFGACSNNRFKSTKK